MHIPYFRRPDTNEGNKEKDQVKSNGQSQPLLWKVGDL